MNQKINNTEENSNSKGSLNKRFFQTSMGRVSLFLGLFAIGFVVARLLVSSNIYPQLFIALTFGVLGTLMSVISGSGSGTNTTLELLRNQFNSTLPPFLNSTEIQLIDDYASHAGITLSGLCPCPTEENKHRMCPCETDFYLISLVNDIKVNGTTISFQSSTTFLGNTIYTYNIDILNYPHPNGTVGSYKLDLEKGTFNILTLEFETINGQLTSI